MIRNVPYELTPAFLDELFTKHNIDFVVHGDDACITADGKDAYAYAKAQRKFKLVKRTEGAFFYCLYGYIVSCPALGIKDAGPTIILVCSASKKNY